MFKSFYKYCLLFFVCITFNTSIAQNWVNVTTDYIKNPSFEEYDTCLAGLQNISACNGWYQPTLADPDYYNTCMVWPFPPNAPAIPNGYGYQFYQFPFHGNGFIGIYSNVLFPIGALSCLQGAYYREYVESKLLRPLEANKFYRFSYRINISNERAGLKIKCVGAYFHQNAINNSNCDAIQAQENVCSPAYVDDTVNWTLATGVFQSIGNEEFLTMGMFTDTADTTGAIIWDPFTSHYILLDSLVLEIQENNYISLPNVFTPNADGVNDEINFKEAFGIMNFNFKLYSRWGEVVYESNDYTKSFVGKNNNGNLLNEGVYFYLLTAEYKDGYKQQLKGFIQLIR